MKRLQKIDETVKRFDPRLYFFIANIMKTLLYTILFLLLGVNLAAQEIVGPERVTPGSLAAFTAPPEVDGASWCLIPNEPQGCFQIDTSSQKLYFASPIEGRYTIIAALIVEGKPLLISKTFTNGKDDAIPPIPTPNPPDTLESWIKTNLPELVKSTNITKEREVIANCFEQTAAKIGIIIKTPQNAQTQLRLTLVSSLAKSSRTAVNDWQLFLEQLGEQLTKELSAKINDINEIKRIFNVVANAIREPKPMASLPESFPTPENCPTCRPTSPFRFLQAL